MDTVIVKHIIVYLAVGYAIIVGLTMSFFRGADDGQDDHYEDEYHDKDHWTDAP